MDGAYNVVFRSTRKGKGKGTPKPEEKQPEAAEDKKPEPAAVATEDKGSSIASATFSGAKPGFVFTTREQGTGYYAEPGSSAPEPEPAYKEGGGGFFANFKVAAAEVKAEAPEDEPDELGRGSAPVASSPPPADEGSSAAAAVAEGSPAPSDAAEAAPEGSGFGRWRKAAAAAKEGGAPPAEAKAAAPPPKAGGVRDRWKRGASSTSVGGDQKKARRWGSSTDQFDIPASPYPPMASPTPGDEADEVEKAKGSPEAEPPEKLEEPEFEIIDSSKLYHKYEELAKAIGVFGKGWIEGMADVQYRDTGTFLGKTNNPCAAVALRLHRNQAIVLMATKAVKATNDAAKAIFENINKELTAEANKAGKVSSRSTFGIEKIEKPDSKKDDLPTPAGTATASQPGDSTAGKVRPPKDGTPSMTLEKLSVSQLKKIANKRNINLTGCVEKGDMISVMRKSGVKDDVVYDVLFEDPPKAAKPAYGIHLPEKEPEHFPWAEEAMRRAKAEGREVPEAADKQLKAMAKAQAAFVTPTAMPESAAPEPVPDEPAPPPRPKRKRAWQPAFAPTPYIAPAALPPDLSDAERRWSSGTAGETPVMPTPNTDPDAPTTFTAGANPDVEEHMFKPELPQFKVWIGNMPMGTTPRAVAEHVASLGMEAVEVEMLPRKEGAKKAMCVVTLEGERKAAQLIRKVDNQYFQGQRVYADNWWDKDTQKDKSENNAGIGAKGGGKANPWASGKIKLPGTY